MKKSILYLGMACLLATMVSSPLNAVNESKPKPKVEATTTMETAEINQILLRIEEIKAMDKAGLNAAERRQLRKELRTMKSDLNATGGGVYLSVGAIIIILLLVILLL